MQFYEVATYAVACGTICLTVFRFLTGSPFGQVWAFPEGFPIVDYRHVLFGEHDSHRLITLMCETDGH